MSKAYGPAGKIANYFINSKLTPLIIIASVFWEWPPWLPFPGRRNLRLSSP